jgi:hypothetical protein
MFNFIEDDLRSNRAGQISTRQQEWLVQLARTTSRWGGATLWVGLVFMIFFVFLILALFMINDGTRKLLLSASPMLAAALCFVLLAIILFSLLGRGIAQKRAAELAKAELLTAQGAAKFGETHNPKWGKGYYLEIGETHFAIDARNSFEEGVRYRVYYGRVPTGNLILSYEKISHGAEV